MNGAWSNAVSEIELTVGGRLYQLTIKHSGYGFEPVYADEFAAAAGYDFNIYLQPISGICDEEIMSEQELKKFVNQHEQEIIERIMEE